MERTLLVIITSIAVIVSATAHWVLVKTGARTEAARQSLANVLPKPNSEKQYVSSDRCQSCHPNEHATWHRSYHRTMTQAALPENVLGAFDGTEIQSDGLLYRVFTEADQFMAELPDPDEMMYVFQGNKPLKPEDIPRVQLPVVMTTGSHHYQTYWVASPRHEGLMQTLPLVYLRQDQRWIPREEAFMRSPSDDARLITQWNHHCIRCHSTGGNPGLDDQSGMLLSKVGELGIACESCHGPGEEHVAYYQNPLNRYRDQRKTQQAAHIVNPADLNHRASSEACGQCHGVFVMENEYAMTYAREGILYRPGKDLHQTRYYIQHPANEASTSRRQDLEQNPQFFRERWWEDGTILAGGREYTAMSVSRCFTHGTMSCLSCHAMHDSDPADQLKPNMRNNQACTQCHTESEYNDQLTAHTYHATDSSGSQCLNCHMPHTTYALFGAIRSHQIESPHIRSSARFGVPNACNLCHLDKTLAWTQDHLVDRYQHERVALSTEQTQTAAALLWLIKGHAAQRAIAGWHFGWKPALEASGDNWQAPFTAQLLNDPYGVVRYVAGKALQSLPGFETWDYDFLAPSQQRPQTVQAAMSHWESQETRASADPATTLQSPEGDVLKARLAAFLANRDDQPITIKE